METIIKPTLTTNELFNMLVNHSKSDIVKIQYITDDTRSKQVKGEKQIQKEVLINSLYLNHKYEQKVQRLSGDTDFQAYEMKGKTRISSTIIQSDKSEEYMLDGKILNSESVKILNYFHKGEIITEAQAVANDLWANSYYNPTEKKTAGRGIVSEEKDFKMITLSLKKIKMIKFKGTEYIIQD